MNSPPQLRRGSLVNELIFLTNTTSASVSPRLSPPQLRRRVFAYDGLYVQSRLSTNLGPPSEN